MEDKLGGGITKKRYASTGATRWTSDVHGETIAVKTSGAYPPPGRVILPAGDLPAYRTTDDARWLVLYRDGREIGRRELRIRAGETVTVTY